MSDQTPPPSTTANPDKMLSSKKAAETLGVSVPFMSKDRLREYPLIPFVKIGAAVRYRMSDLLAFIESKTHRPA